MGDSDEERKTRERVARNLTSRLLGIGAAPVECPGCMGFYLSQDEHGRGAHSRSCMFRNTARPRAGIGHEPARGLAR